MKVRNLRVLYWLTTLAVSATTVRAVDEIHFLRALNMNSNDINCARNVRVGSAVPASMLDVAGNATIGNAYGMESTFNITNAGLIVMHVTTNYTQLDPNYSDLTDYGIGTILQVEPHHQPTGIKLYYGNFTVVKTMTNWTYYRAVALQGQAEHCGAGTVSGARGIAGVVNNDTNGTIVSAVGGSFGVLQGWNTGVGGVISNAIGVQVFDINSLGVTVRRAGILVEPPTPSLNASLLVLGSKTIPDGHYAIYNASTLSNYFAGDVGIGVAAPLAKLHVNGPAIVATPTAANHAATKGYVDAASNSLVNLSTLQMPGGETVVSTNYTIALGYNSGVRTNGGLGSANVGYNNSDNTTLGWGSMNLGCNDGGVNRAAHDGDMNIGNNWQGTNTASGYGSINLGDNEHGRNDAVGAGSINAGVNWGGVNTAAQGGSVNVGANWGGLNTASADGSLNAGYYDHATNIASSTGAMNLGYNAHGESTAAQPGSVNLGANLEGLNRANGWGAMNLGLNQNGLNSIEAGAGMNIGYNYHATNIITTLGSGAINAGIVQAGGINVASYSGTMNLGQNYAGSNSACAAAAINMGRNMYGVNVAAGRGALNVGCNESGVNTITGDGGITLGFNNKGYRLAAGVGSLIGGATKPGGTNIVIASATGAWAVGHGVIVSHQYAYVFGTNLYSVRENSLVCQNLDVFGSITVSAAPANPENVATKAYVDAKSHVAVYWFCTKTPNSVWKNNTSAEDWNWDDYVVPLNGNDHDPNGTVEIKLRLYGNSDDSATMYVGVRNHTDSTDALAPVATGLSHDGGWWESAWTTVTYTTLKELRLSAYISDNSKYYYIKRAMILVR